MSRNGRALAWVSVGLGGALGTLARAGTAHLLPHSPSSLPTATLTVNLLGCLVLGVLLGRLALFPDAGWRRVVRLGLGTGFCGGLTTYSTFMVEVLKLTGSAGEPAGNLGLGLTYWTGSIVAGVACAALGLWLGMASVRPGEAGSGEAGSGAVRGSGEASASAMMREEGRR